MARELVAKGILQGKSKTGGIVFNQKLLDNEHFVSEQISRFGRGDRIAVYSDYNIGTMSYSISWKPIVPEDWDPVFQQ